MSVKPLDARAKQILFDTYWQSTGWVDRGDRVTPAADIVHAKRHGMMFERFTGTHATLITKLKRAAKAITPQEVSDAFLASLSSRRPDLRSGIASWAYANELAPHRFNGEHGNPWCADCGGLAQYKHEDLDVLNFERHKWGGVRHSQPLYQYVDLIALRATLPATPEPADHAIWANIVAVIDRMPKSEGPSKLSQRLKGVLPSAKDERNQLLEILAILGILAPKQERSSPGEWMHVGMWRAADGYNKKIANQLFAKPRKATARALASREEGDRARVVDGGHVL